MSLPGRVCLLLYVALVLLATGCGMGSDMGKAHAAVEDFHKLLDDGKLKEIYATTDAEFRTATSEAQFIEFAEAIRNQLGGHRSSSQTAFNVNANGGASTVELTMDSKFEKGERMETFVYVITKSSCNLQRYAIRTAGQDADVARARAAVTEFHKLRNDGMHKEIYAATDAVFKSGTPEADFIAFMENFHGPLGRHKKLTQMGYTANPADSGSTVVLSVASEFEKGRRMEKFTYAVTKSDCTLQHYSIKKATEGPDVVLAQAAVAEFHRQMNESRHADMYRATTAAFKKASTEADFAALMDSIKSKLGRHQNTTQTMPGLDTVDGTTTVDMTVQSDFEQGKAEEVFGFVVTNAACVLESYRIKQL